MSVIRRFLFSVSFIAASLHACAQNSITGTGTQSEIRDTTYKNAGAETLTLRQCVDYALQHQPALNKALININIARETNGVNLSGLLPQVSASGSLVHYIQQPGSGNVAVDNTGAVTTRQTIANTFVPGIAVSQAIFSPALIYTVRSAPLLVKEANLATDSTKIFVVTSVTKTFYSLLLNLQQIGVLKDDTARLGKNLLDAYHQYKGGIVDETDYEEASITLNNSRAQLKQAQENVIPQYAALKQLIGYPVERQFNVDYDTLQMKRDIDIDTLQQLKFEKRIEYQQINTEKALQTQLIHYYHTSFLPTVSAFFNYNLDFQSAQFGNIFQTSFPSSLVGLSLSVPIFTGFARIHNERRAQLQERSIEWDETNLKLQINKEYTTALASYKGNRYSLQLLQKNVELASRVYFVVKLQYQQGIIPYLNVITAESNLITSKISYINALFQVLSSKIDLQKSMGSIPY